MPAKRLTGNGVRAFLLGLFGLGAAGAGGCATLWPWHSPPPADTPAGQSMVLRGGQVIDDPSPSKQSGELANARELYRRNEFAAAEKVFHRIAENKHNSPQIAEEARFYEGECLREQQHYPQAVDTYHRMQLDFPVGVYRQEASLRMLAIAEYWLKDTFAEMEQEKQKREGKRWLVVPAVCHFDKTKPFIDEEGRALQALENAFLGDVQGPAGDKALYLAGTVKFFREDYKEADHFYNMLVEQYPHSELAAEALERAIVAKHLSTGGAEYDGRKSAEAYQLIEKARTSFPKMAQEKGPMLDRVQAGILMQQAAKDWDIAEFYRRTNHPGSAYFMYEIVRRRYQGTKYEEQAVARMNQLRQELEEAQKRPNGPGVFGTIRESWEGLWSRQPKPPAQPGLPGVQPSPTPPPAEAPQPLPLPRSLPSDLAPR